MTERVFEQVVATATPPVLTPGAVLAGLQRGVDMVKGEPQPALQPGEDLADDVGLDSLDAIDVLSVAEAELPPGVVDTVMDRLADLRTVGDLVAAVLQAAAAPS